MSNDLADKPHDRLTVACALRRPTPMSRAFRDAVHSRISLCTLMRDSFFPGHS